MADGANVRDGAESVHRHRHRVGDHNQVGNYVVHSRPHKVVEVWNQSGPSAARMPKAATASEMG